MSKKILTLEEQKHLYLSIAEIFDDASEQDIASIIAKLGLDSVVDEGGNIVPVYSLSIVSDKPTFVTGDYDIELKGRVYNYFAEITDDVVSWEWTRDSGNAAQDEDWNEGKTQKVLNLTRADFPSNFEERDTTFKLKAVLLNGSIITGEIEFSRVQTFSSVQIETSRGLFIEGTPDSIYAEAVTDFQVRSYKWYIDGSLSGTGRSYSLANELVPLGGSIILKVVAEDMRGGLHSDVMSIPRLENGEPGEPGVDGPPGADGRSTYTWIKYADGPNGEGMNEYPIRQDGSAREYIGLAPNKSSPIESENPADYTWSRYIGEDGVPGENGYMWIKYSKWENGRDTNGTPDMHDTPFIIEPGGGREDMLFMGIAYNKDERQEADQNTPEGAPEQYLWSRIKGEDGHTGYILELSNDNVSIPANSDGETPVPEVAYSHATTSVTLYYGNDIVPTSEFGLVLTPENVTYTSPDEGMSVQIESLTSLTGSLKFSAYPKLAGGSLDMTDKIASATFTLSKVLNSSAYEIMPNTSAFLIELTYGGSQAEEVTPDKISVKILKNTGTSTEYVTTGRLTYRYIYANNVDTDDDGTQMVIDQDKAIDIAGNPLFLELKYFHPTSNQLVDRERIPFVRDGLPGNYTEFRYKVEASSATTVTLTPTEKTTADLTSKGWLLTPGTPPSGGMLWMIQAQKTPSGDLIGEWSNPIPFTGEQGISGTTGMIPRLMEWIVGAEYEIGGEYIDYVYFRTSDERYEGWYTVKIPAGSEGDRIVKTANSGIPDSANFQKEPFTSSAQFGTVIAEQANLAGFIFRNRRLTSQDETVQTCGTAGSGTSASYPNLTIDGNRGELEFLRRIKIDKDGIVLKDDCQRERMIFQFQDGVPMLQFLDEQGVVTWEAGKDGYRVITVGTQEPSWDTPFGIRKVSALASDDETLADRNRTSQPFVRELESSSKKNAVILEAAGTEVSGGRTLGGTLLRYVPVDCGPNSPPQSVGENFHPWFTAFEKTAFPNTPDNTTTFKIRKYNKGDTLPAKDHYEAYYRDGLGPINMSEIDSPGSAAILAPDGWYFMEGHSRTGVNRDNGYCDSTQGVYPMMEVFNDNPGTPTTVFHILKFMYLKKGQIISTKQVVKTAQRTVGLGPF